MELKTTLLRTNLARKTLHQPTSGRKNAYQTRAATYPANRVILEKALWPRVSNNGSRIRAMFGCTCQVQSPIIKGKNKMAFRDPDLK
jgi:hypothetical protein